MSGQVRLKENPYRIEFVFPYDPHLIELVRLIEGRSYDTALKIWWLPPTPGHAKTAIEFGNKHDLTITPPVLELSKQDGAPVSVAAMGRVMKIHDDEVRIFFPFNDALREALKLRIPGREWDGDGKYWKASTSIESLLALAKFAAEWEFIGDIDKIADLAGQMHSISAEAIEASKASDADFDVDGLGGELKPFQRAGVKYGVDKKRLIIGDEMGLGKTVEALAILQALNAFPAIVICPANLKLNWYRETAKWLPGRSIQVLGKDETFGRANSDVVIINYDQLKNYREFLVRREFKALIADESHLLKNAKTVRASIVEEIAAGCLYGKTEGGKTNRRHKEKLRPPCEIRLLLSGTPLLNRPDELTSQLQIIGRLAEFGGWYGFVKEYCGMEFGRFGVDTSGAKNLKQLHDRLRATCYLRRLKSEVLKELPPKQRAVMPVAITNRNDYNRAEAELIAWLKANRGEGAAGAAERAEQLVRINTLKQLSARGKMAAIIEWCNDFLDTGEKLVVFAWHKEFVIELANALKCDAIYGDGKSAEVRQDKVDRFQNDPNTRCIVLNLLSGGVGLTLTAASNVAFVELGWNPATMDQAGDRCHRIGQTDSVTEWWFVGAKTIDEWIHELIQNKREVVNAAVDGNETVGEVSILNELVARLVNDEPDDRPALDRINRDKTELELF